MGALTTPIVSPLTRAITAALTGMGEASSAPALSALTLAWSAGASTLTIGATSSIDLERFGAYISEGEGVDPVTGGSWFDGAGAVAGAQSLVLTQAALEAELGALPASAVLNVSHGYSLTDPAVIVVLAASSGIYPTPVVYTAAVDDTTPTEDALITGSWDMIVGPTGQVITYRYQNVTEGVTNATTLTYTPDAGDVGDTLQFRVTSTLGALTAYDDSDVTSAVVAAGFSLFGNQLGTNGSVSASTTSFFGLGASNGDATEVNRQSPIPAAITITDMVIGTRYGQPASGALVITLRKNGSSAGSFSVTIGAGTSAGVYTGSGSISFAAGDLLSFEAVNSATAGSLDVISMTLKGA